MCTEVSFPRNIPRKGRNIISELWIKAHSAGSKRFCASVSCCCCSVTKQKQSGMNFLVVVSKMNDAPGHLMEATSRMSRCILSLPLRYFNHNETNFFGAVSRESMTKADTVDTYPHTRASSTQVAGDTHWGWGGITCLQ